MTDQELQAISDMMEFEKQRWRDEDYIPSILTYLAFVAVPALLAEVERLRPFESIVRSLAAAYDGQGGDIFELGEEAEKLIAGAR